MTTVSYTVPNISLRACNPHHPDRSRRTAGCQIRQGGPGYQEGWSRFRYPGLEQFDQRLPGRDRKLPAAAYVGAALPAAGFLRMAVPMVFPLAVVDRCLPGSFGVVAPYEWMIYECNKATNPGPSRCMLLRQLCGYHRTQSQRSRCVATAVVNCPRTCHCQFRSGSDHAPGADRARGARRLRIATARRIWSSSASPTTPMRAASRKAISKLDGCSKCRSP